MAGAIVHAQAPRQWPEGYRENGYTLYEGECSKLTNNKSHSLTDNPNCLFGHNIEC